MGFDPERHKFTVLEYFDFRHTCTETFTSRCA